VNENQPDTPAAGPQENQGTEGTTGKKKALGLQAVIALVSLSLGVVIGQGVSSEKRAIPASSAADEQETKASFDSKSVDTALRQNLSALMKERFPKLQEVKDIRTTPVNGLLELRADNEIVYVDRSGRYLVQGVLLDTQEKRNLTAIGVEDMNRVAFSALPLADAIVSKNGDGKRKVVVFADPNCSYCKRFEPVVDKLENATVYRVLYPVLGPDSVEKSKRIACAKDPLKAWSDWMTSGVEPPAYSSSCKTDARRALEFGKKYAVSGTPTVFLEDGTRIRGATTFERLDQAVLAAEPSSRAR
jgi:thiol:disulfide interchange protein DsbC